MTSVFLIALATLLGLLLARRPFRRWLWWRIARNEARRFHPGRALCPACAQRLPLRRHFCLWCHAPVSGYAATGPIQRVAATGELYRRAVSHPSPMAVAGLWLLAAPGLLGFLFSVFLSPQAAGSAALATFLTAVLPVAIALKATLRFLSTPPSSAPNA